MASYRGKVVGGSLNIRPEPNLNQYGIGQIANNTEITVSDCSNSAWFAVTYNNVSGYVMREFVQVTGRVINGRLRLRATPDSNGTFLVWIPDNTEIKVTYHNSGWYATSYGGYSGYVSSPFVALVPIGQTGGNSELFVFNNLPGGAKQARVFESTGSGYTFVSFVYPSDCVSCRERSATDDYLYLDAKNGESFSPQRYIKRDGVDVSYSSYSIHSLLSTSLLQNGSTGRHVCYLQHFLNRFFDVCNFSTLTVDGDFGSATENAVKKVQQYCNVTADGVVGSNTRNAIAANLPA